MPCHRLVDLTVISHRHKDRAGYEDEMISMMLRKYASTLYFIVRLTHSHSPTMSSAHRVVNTHQKRESTILDVLESLALQGSLWIARNDGFDHSLSNKICGSPY